MAQDQLCKFCEDSEDPERGVLLICDLTGSGELPFAIGINCLPDWLTTMLEAIAIPEGIPASAPAELGEEDAEDDARAAEIDRVFLGEPDAPDAPRDETEDPTSILEPFGPSPVESSAPDTGNGSGKTLSKSRTAATKTTE
jgi:hypothetical protein